MSFIAAALIGGGASIAATAIGTFGGKKTKLPSLPPFQSDPLVGTAENSIFNFGSDVLKGILPSSYQDLLQFDSPQFESVLHNSNRDVQAAGLETAARTGNINSGAAQAGIDQAVANNSANLRYSDYLNTVANKKALLGTGLDAEQVAGNMALTNQGQINSYTLGGYSAMLGADVNMAGLSQKSQAATGQGIGQGLGSILGSIPYIASAMSPMPGVANDGGIPSTGLVGALGSANKDGGLNIDDIIKKISENAGSSSALTGALG